MSADLEYPLAGSSVGQPLFLAGGDYSPTRSRHKRQKSKAKLASTATIKCILSGVGAADIDSTPFPIADSSVATPWSVTFAVPDGTFASGCIIKVMISYGTGAYSEDDRATGITVGSAANAPPPGGIITILIP